MVVSILFEGSNRVSLTKPSAIRRMLELSSGMKNVVHLEQGEPDFTTRARVHSLFRLAREVIHEDPELAQRYVKIARKIAMGTKLRLPKEYRRLVCRNCKSLLNQMPRNYFLFSLLSLGDRFFPLGKTIWTFLPVLR